MLVIPGGSPRSPRSRRPILPNKADAPLIVDPHAMLPRAISPKRFEPVSGRGRKVTQRLGLGRGGSA